MKSIVTVLLVGLLLVGCNSEKRSSNAKTKVITVSGKVGFPKEGNITISSWNDTTQSPQALEFDRSTYTYKGAVKVSEPGYYRVNFFNAQFVDVILDKANLEVNADGNSQNGFYEVIGSPDVRLFQQIQSIRSQFNESAEMARLNEDFNNARSINDEKAIETLQAKYQQVLKIPTDSIAGLLVQSAPSIGVIEVLTKRELDPEQYFSTYEAVASKFTGDWANYSMAKDFLDMVAKMNALAVGQMAPEIELPNPEGKLVKLSSLRGKYVLVDFWAKWCGPCRRENPNVVAAYHKFNKKGFEVFGVSLDKNHADWTMAIQQDGLTWTHVLDLNSEAAKVYNISAIPFSILLDKNGVIVGKNLRGEALHKKLEELL